MEMTLTEDWLPKPGALVEFTATDATLDAAAAATPSEIPPTFIQESHIRRWAERRHGDNPLASELSLCFTVAEPLDRTALRQAFTTFLRRHDTLRSWFDLDESGGGFALTRYLVGADDVELTTTETGVFASGEELRDTLVEKYRAAADPTRWPAFVCGAIDHGADGFTLLYNTDHAFSDGLSLVTAIFELHGLYTAYAADQEPPLLPVGSYVEFARTERAAVAAGSPELDRMAELLAANADRVRPLPIDLGLAPGTVAESRGTKLDLLDAAECEAFAEASRAAGGGFSAGLFAAIALAEHELTGRTHYLGLNVVGTRNEPQYQLAQGWFINLLPIAFDFEAGQPFTDLVSRASGALDAVKPLGNVPIHAALQRAAGITGSPLPVTTDWPWVSYMDVRAISGAALELALPNVSGINGLGSRSKIGQTSPVWFSRELDRLHVTVMYPDTEAAHTSATDYLERVRTTLRTVARTGRFTAAATEAKGP
ncbi:condensation domain-containing protein [Nocardia sp. NPDC052566]|uniref:condensation domain-containing protein n=1 Tax=Nocardia sp. NPDC052566 TaxID=3364330 RepID=UPI0037CB8146